MALTAKQRRFAEEYRVDWNATQAAIRAGYSPKTAKSIGQRLLTFVDVQNYIAELTEAKRKETDITVDRVLAELARLAFFDIRKLADDEGKPLPLQSLDGDTAAAIAGLDVVDYYEAGDEGKKEWAGWVKKYKLADKVKSLELLGKHLGMFTDKMEVSGNLNNGKLDQILEQLKDG